MTKKSYQKRLPTVLPPALRPAPALESLPASPPTPEPASPPTPESASRPTVPEVAPVAPPPDPSGPRSRTALAALVLLGPLVLVGALLATYAAQDDDPPEQSRDLGAPAAQEPGVLPEESYVEARVQRDGDIVVRQWIRSKVPLRTIALALPAVPDAVVTADQVQVLADDVRATGPRTIGRGEATYTFEEATDVRVRYRLVGAVLRSSSVTGRGLAVATTLDVRWSPQPAQETRVIHAPEVLSLACAASGGEPPQPCGSAEGDDRWRVDLTGPRVVDRVLAQLTLSDEDEDSEADADADAAQPTDDDLS